MLHKLNQAHSVWLGRGGDGLKVGRDGQSVKTERFCGCSVFLSSSRIFLVKYTRKITQQQHAMYVMASYPHVPRVELCSFRSSINRVAQRVIPNVGLVVEGFLQYLLRAGFTPSLALGNRKRKTARSVPPPPPHPSSFRRLDERGCLQELERKGDRVGAESPCMDVLISLWCH